MRLAHQLAAAAAVLAVVLGQPAAARADQQVTQTFSADSGDSCRYGFTDGTLTWSFGPVSPLPVAGVIVRGRVADRPMPTDPVLQCRDDGMFSVATFTAFSGSREVDREAGRADNGSTSLQFVLGSAPSTTPADRVVIQVCRYKAASTVPGYCGRAVEYRVPPVATP